MQELDALRALAVEGAAMAPPEDVVLLIHEGLAVARVAATHTGLPEAAGELLAGDVAPAHVDVALIGNLVPDDGLSPAGPVLIGILHVPVQVLALEGAVGYPGS